MGHAVYPHQAWTPVDVGTGWRAVTAPVERQKPAMITPPELMPVVGPLIALGSGADRSLTAFDATYRRTELARFRDFVSLENHPSGAWLDGNHYGGLRSRLMWAIRTGEPYGRAATDEARHGYARGRRILKRYLQWSEENNFALQPHHNTGMADVEALWVLEGDSNALSHIHVTAMAATVDRYGYLKLRNPSSDARIVSVALQAASAAHRLKIPFERNPANNQMGFDNRLGSWKAVGEQQIRWLDEFEIVKADGSIPSPAHKNGREAYLFNAMLARELLNWSAYVEWNENAVNIARRIVDHLIESVRPGWPTLGYVTDSREPSTDLASFYVWPSLALWQETGESKYRDFALASLRATRTAYIDRMKQWNQVFSTLAQGAEALLAGESWRPRPAGG
jgi:hypothetical protein